MEMAPQTFRKFLRIVRIAPLIAVFIIFFPPDCLAQWVARYDGPGHGHDSVSSMAIDSNGNIYVAGISQGNAAGRLDFGVVKYDVDGNPSSTWPDVGFGVGVRRYNDGWALDIAVDGSGNVYVTGHSFTSSTRHDIVTIKYDSNGNQSSTWPNVGFGIGVRRYNGPGNDSDEPVAIAVDDSGNVFVAGTTKSFSTTLSDFIVIKYDANGNYSPNWPSNGAGAGVRIYTRPGYFFDPNYSRIALDPSGNLYVGTGIYDQSSIPPPVYAVVLKFDPNGNLSSTWPDAGFGVGARLSGAQFLSMLVDSSSNVYVLGSYADNPTGTYKTMITKYDANGSLSSSWPDIGFGAGVRMEDVVPTSFTLDSSGNLYTLGRYSIIGTYNVYATTIKYDSQGHHSTTWPDNGSGVGVRQRPIGCCEFFDTFIAVDNVGNVYEILSIGSDYNVTKLDNMGNPSTSWPDVGLGIGVRNYNGPGNYYDVASAIIVDGLGNAYVTGSSYGMTDPSNVDYATIKIGANGDNDGDGDGRLDSEDNCLLRINPDQMDSDGDGDGNACDNCGNIPNAGQEDSDSDGIGNACENDDDNDSRLDSSDNCTTVFNSYQNDHDNDGIGDACDSDDDNDSIVDVSDNCPLVISPNQTDTDGDGFGDVCDVLSAHVPLDIKPYGVAVNPVTNRIYVTGYHPSNGSNGAVVKILDGSTLSVINDLCCIRIDGDTGVSSLPVVNPQTNRIYLLEPPDWIDVIDGATNEWLNYFRLDSSGNTPLALAVNPATNRFYVYASDGSPGFVRVFDGSDNSVIADIPMDPSFTPAGYYIFRTKGMMAVNSVTNRVYVPGQNELAVIDGSTNSVITNISLDNLGPLEPMGENGIAINPATNRIYVAGTRWVAVIDGSTNELVGYIDDNVTPTQGIAVNSISNRVYVAGYENDFGGGFPQIPRMIVADGDKDISAPYLGLPPLLSEIATSTGSQKWEFGGTGDGIALDPVSNRIYLAGWKYTLGDCVNNDRAGCGWWLTVLVGATTFTGTGNNISTQPVDATTGAAPITLTFSEVTQSGDTILSSSSTEPAPSPLGFAAGDPVVYYDVSTTATFDGIVTLCLTWTEGQFDNENNIQLFHYHNGWQQITIEASRDKDANKVCGQTTSLSPFALFERSYSFTGFFAPVDNPPTRNAVKAGAAVPVKFSLGSNQGLSIFTSGYPASQSVQCDTSAPLSAIEETVSAGGSSLTYDASSGQYSYVWKTNKAWANTCRRLVLNFNDGTTKTAEFSFTK